MQNDDVVVYIYCDLKDNILHSLSGQILCAAIMVHDSVQGLFELRQSI